MKIKPLLCAAMVAATCLVAPSTVHAADYTTPQELLSDMLTYAVSGISDVDYSDEIASVLTGVQLDTTTNIVSYKGDPIGTWDAALPNLLSTTTGGNHAVCKQSGTQWFVHADILATLVQDIDHNLLDGEVDETTTWTADLFKYGITLGGVKFNPKQVITPFAIRGSNVMFDDGCYLDITDKYQIKISDLEQGVNELGYIPFLIDANGDLYVYSVAQEVYSKNSGKTVNLAYIGADGATGLGGWFEADVDTGDINKSIGDYLNIYLLNTSNSTTASRACIFLIKEDGDTSTYLRGLLGSRNVVTNRYEYLKVGDPSVIYDETVAPLHTGVLLYNGATAGIDASVFTNMFSTTPSINRLTSLDPDTVVELSPTGWAVSDYGSVGAGSQSVNTAGSVANVPAVATVDAMSFKVVVPTSLPIYVDTLGITYTASNAVIENYSNASIELSSVVVEPTKNSGWRLVDTVPSETRDAKEFNLTTSITDGVSIGRNGKLPFQYRAALSPVTDGITNLEIASVLITVDWVD